MIFIPIICVILAAIHIVRLYKEYGKNIGHMPDLVMRIFWGTLFVLCMLCYLWIAYLVGQALAVVVGWFVA